MEIKEFGGKLPFVVQHYCDGVLPDDYEIKLNGK